MINEKNYKDSKVLVGLIALRLFSALPFAVYYSSLQLYLLNTSLSKNMATSIVGSVLALSYGTALLGGYLADRYISYRAFFLFSIICELIGCLTFTTLNPSHILWFSSLFLLGGSGLAVSINMMVTQRYEPQDEHRERAFFWIYMSLNVGYLIGYSLAGYYGNLGEYQKIPFFIAFFTLIAILLTFFYWKKIDTPRTKYNPNTLSYMLLILVALFFIIRLLLQFPAMTNLSIIFVWLLFSAVTLFVLIRNHLNFKREILIFYLLLFAAVVFWSIYFLAPMALMVFIKNNVALNMFSINIAPQWVQNINTFIIILGTMILGSKSAKKPVNTWKIAKQFSLSLLLMGLGFIALVLGIIFHSEQGKVSLIWITSSYILQSLGELLIGPIGYALVGRLIPKLHHSFMMGIWVTLLGVAGAISSMLSALVPYSTSSVLSLPYYQHFFISISIIVILTGAIIYLISAKLTQTESPSLL